MDPVAAAAAAGAEAVTAARHRPQCIISGSKLLPDVFHVCFFWSMFTSEGGVRERITHLNIIPLSFC